MAIMLNLEPETESQLAELAQARGQTVEEYLHDRIDELILNEPIRVPPIKNGAELVEYWKKEGIIGSRPDITDSVEYARALRRKAERREHCE